MEIRNMSVFDLEKIKDVLFSEFDDFWTYNIFKEELKNPNSQYFVAQIDNEIVGFAGILKILDEIHITNIVTKISNRHTGIASSLLKKLITVSNLECATLITLEVNELNTNAINLYEKFNFKKLGLRKNYYGQNRNALIMTLYLK